jgi:hypothetical protein
MTAVLVYLAVVAGEAQLSGAQYEAGGRCPLNERKRMHISPAKGMCALAGWQGGSSHGKVESGFLFVSRVQTRGKGKSQDWQSQSGTFLFAGPSRFHHTHTHTHTHVEFIEFITEQRIRHRYLRQYLLAGLMHCCCFCWISGRRNGRRFVVCMSTCVCAAAIPVPDRSVLL